MWTMDELVERVRLALADAYPGAPNGRVRDVPDRRAIRWYATTGLIDRPTAMRGRVALYSSRHLLQVVAVKRRQAEGHSLAEIQGELAGASDETLSAIAHVPTALLAAPASEAAAAGSGSGSGSTSDAVRARFWAAPSSVSAPTPPAPTPPARTLLASASEAATSAPPAPAASMAADATVTLAASGGLAAVPVAGVGLRGGVILVLPAAPEAGDYDDIAAAAEPLLDLLAARGLLTHDTDTHADKGSPS